MKKYIVYLIINMINGKYYVGYSSREFAVRWYEHCQNIKGNWHFKNAVNLYKPESFNYEIIASSDTKKEALSLEKLWIITLRAYDPEVGYNMTFGGEDGSPTEETKRLISSRKKGCISSNKGRIWITDGTRNRTIYPNEEIPTGWYTGRFPRTQESRNKTSNTLLNMISITDGKSNHKIRKNQDIPEGWHEGVTVTWYCGHPGRIHSQEEKLKRANSIKQTYALRGKRIYITNGSLVRAVYKESAIPTGWYKGGLNRKHREDLDYAA